MALLQGYQLRLNKDACCPKCVERKLFTWFFSSLLCPKQLNRSNTGNHRSSLTYAQCCCPSLTYAQCYCQSFCCCPSLTYIPCCQSFCCCPSFNAVVHVFVVVVFVVGGGGGGFLFVFVCLFVLFCSPLAYAQCCPSVGHH